MRVATALVFSLTALLFSSGPVSIASVPERNPQDKPDQGPAPPLGKFVLYAQRSIQLAAAEKITGNVGVHAAALGVAGGQLVIGSSSSVAGSLLSPSVEIDSSVTFDRVLTNEASGPGAPPSTPPFPAVKMPALPYLTVPAAAGTKAFTVGAGQTLNVPPGTYGALSVASGGTALLIPGVYVFSQVTLSPSAKLTAFVGSTTANTTIEVLGDFDAQGTNTIGSMITSSTPASASQLVIFVYGSAPAAGNGGGSEQGAVHLGVNSVVTGLVATPHGTLRIDNGVAATGAFAGYEIAVKETATITFQDGFPDGWGEQTGAQRLGGYLPTHPGLWPIVKEVPLDTTMSLAISLPVAKPKDFPELKDFVKQVSDPKRPDTFRHFISRDEFKSRYGASETDYKKLTDWAHAAGLSTKSFSNNLLLAVTGTAGQFERAFNVFLLFRQRADGSSFVSVDRDPSLNLTVPVLDIGGLASFVVPEASVTVNGTGISGSKGNPPSSYRPADLKAAYLGGAACSKLTGAGQTVGLIEFQNYSNTDVLTFDARNLIGAPLPPIVLQEGGNPPSGLLAEADLDVDMVEGLAPGANILVFQGSSGITLHLDDAYNAMATSNPTLTVASSSLVVKASGGEQQALDEMAAQGTTFFRASGDFGDIGDPQDDADMSNQTLVGGTILSTNPLIAAFPPYPTPYYAGDTAWNQGNPQTKDATGGGIMNGNVARGVCYFCAGQTDIPDYQVATQQESASRNGGSTSARNYPDVAWPGALIEIVVNGKFIIASGTSVAAPLWAGFTALANQQQAKNGGGKTMGFLNPTLYDIGETQGTADDLYSKTFNDMKDGSTNANGWGPGFKAVSGYDLVSGWGTPTCALLGQLATKTPLTDKVPLVELEFVIGTGGDNLESYSEVDADILLPDGKTHLHEVVHPQNAGEWQNYDADNGGHPRTIGGFTVPFPDPQITESSPLKSVTLTFIEHNSFPNSADNWDMTSLTVNAYTGNSKRVCQIKLVGHSQLDDSTTGLFRFKQNFDPDCTTPSGILCGPNHTFSGGC